MEVEKNINHLNRNQMSPNFKHVWPRHLKTFHRLAEQIYCSLAYKRVLHRKTLPYSTSWFLDNSIQFPTASETHKIRT